MKTLLKPILTLILVCLSAITEAYIQNRTDADAIVHWSTNLTTLDIYLNPANTQGYSTSLIQSQVATAISEWNGKSRLTLRQFSTSTTNQSSLNEIYFTGDPTIFGSGVVGITQVFYKNNTGEILEADILINDNETFSSNMFDQEYLGNVIAHELGHLLGLGHSQVIGSTMFYALSRGQNKIDDDDKAGLYSIYPNGDSAKGSITGKIIGGSSLTGIFGAHVAAISLKTGKVSAATISEPSGSFTIQGLNKNDQYYIYTSPIAQVGLPSRYSVAKNDFCNSSQKYRGSFFQSCGSSDEGYPQTISLNTSSVDVGKITVRCGVDVPVEYISKKNDLVNTFDIQDGVVSGVGNSFIGYFSTQELAQSSPADHFKIPYSQFTTSDWANLTSSGDLFVELKIINQALYSPFKANVSVTSSSGNVYGLAKYTTENDGWLNLESTFHLPINRGNPSDNDFAVTITPEIMEGFSFPTSLPYTKADYFPSPSSFSDSLRFYLISASIVKSNGNGTYSFVSYKNKQLTDNASCPDAVNTYALSNYTVKGSSSSVKKKSEAIACGIVDMQSGPGSGPGGFFIGLLLSFILCHLTSSIIKNKKRIPHDLFINS